MNRRDKRYENLTRKELARIVRELNRIYRNAISDISITAANVRFDGKVFDLSKYPQLRNKIDAVIRQMQPRILTLVRNGVSSMWDLSNQKNDELVDSVLRVRNIPKSLLRELYDPNRRALASFQNRREKGLNLSDRIWKSLDPFRKELEGALGFTIRDGKSAAETAREVRKYLNEPDKLFRRVRSEEGKLVLSKAARSYHPGQGVYRSSYKNALRLTRTENNMAFRTADFTRWQSLPFVIGIDVRLSAAHPRYDICDQLAGRYPKDFLFRGWHAQCICNAVPVLASQEEIEKMEDAILNGEDPSQVPGVNDTPASFKQWNQENAERVKGWKSKPYFMTDNSKYL